MKKLILPKPTKLFPRKLGYCAGYYYLQDYSEKELLKEIYKRTTPEQRKHIKEQPIYRDAWDDKPIKWSDFHHIWLVNILKDLLTDDELSAMTELVIQNGDTDFATLEWDSGVKA